MPDPSPAELAAFSDLIGLGTGPTGTAQPYAIPTVSLDGALNQRLPWLIGPRIQPGDCCYFVGIDSQGKTTLVVDIRIGYVGACYGLWTDTLAGAWPINQEGLTRSPRVLVVNAETAGPGAWRHKLVATLTGRGIRYQSTHDELVRSRFSYVESTDIPMRLDHMQSDVQRFAEWAVSEQFTLVVLDPVFSMFRPPDNGDSTWVIHGLKPMIDIFKAHSITTFCIAHPNSESLRAGNRGGPSLDAAFTPFGSFQQRAVMDCRFGVRRTPNVEGFADLIKFKDRRAGWIPQEARIQLEFGNEAGFRSHEKVKSDWELHNPQVAHLSDTTAPIFLKLPPRFDIETAASVCSVSENTARKAVRECLDQGLYSLTELPERGAPKLYTLTELGEAHAKYLRDRAAKDQAAKAARAKHKRKS